ncbi:2-dehydropantoate 2-reductase [Archangium sp.]|uniref:2-dehydropantoate 2-reductase n=1 Tax=Archangium sp. TaxID=1872627 RepID=UPI00286A37FB|nr:2-dehydropantoate 2-reductase [Archangium sp.]
MRIAVIGAGGVGGYFGGRLAAAGEEVTFLCRGAHLRALQEHGLRVESIKGDFSVHPLRVTDRPEDLGTPDIILLCVKSFQVPEVAPGLRGNIGPNTLVVPLQNSIEPLRVLPPILGEEHVVGGMCRIISFQAGPGIIRHVSAEPDVTFGRRDGQDEPRLEALRAAFVRAGVSATLSRDIQATLWEKLVFVATMGGLGAVTRAPIGVIREMPETRAMFERAMREVMAVAQASGMRVAANIVEQYMTYIDALTPTATSSMQRDIQEERVSELLECNGAIVTQARRVGVSASIHEFIYSSLLPGELRRRRRLTFPGDTPPGG